MTFLSSKIRYGIGEPLNQHRHSPNGVRKRRENTRLGFNSESRGCCADALARLRSLTEHPPKSRHSTRGEPQCLGCVPGFLSNPRRAALSTEQPGFIGHQ